MKVVFTQQEVEDILLRYVAAATNLDSKNTSVKFLTDYADGSGIEEIKFNRAEVELNP